MIMIQVQVIMIRRLSESKSESESLHRDWRRLAPGTQAGKPHWQLELEVKFKFKPEFPSHVIRVTVHHDSDVAPRRTVTARLRVSLSPRLRVCQRSH